MANISRINPLGKNTGLDYVYNSNPVQQALQTGLLMDQRQAMQEAASEYRRQQLKQRAQEAELKSMNLPEGSADWYSDYDTQDRNVLTQSLVDSHSKGTYDPIQASIPKGQYGQQKKVYQAASKEHEKYITQQDPYIDKAGLRSVMHEKRIEITDPEFKKRKGLDNFAIPVSQIHEASMDDYRIYKPAEIGAYVVKNLSGKDSYQIQNPNGTGEIITREKIFDKTGKLNPDIAKDILFTNPKLNRAYTALYNKKMADQQSLGLIQGVGTPMEQKRIADQTVKEIFPEMLGDFTVKTDNTPVKGSSGGASPLKNLGIEQGEVSERVNFQVLDKRTGQWSRNEDTDYVTQTRPVTALYEAKKNALSENRIAKGTRYRSLGNPVGANGTPITGHSIFEGDAVVSNPAMTAVVYTKEPVTLSNGVHFRGAQEVPKEFLNDPNLKGKVENLVGFEVVPLESQEVTNTSKTYELDKQGNPILVTGRATTSGNDKEGTPRVNKKGKIFIELGDAPASLTALFRQKLGSNYEKEVNRYRNMYKESGAKKVPYTTLLNDLGVK